MMRKAGTYDNHAQDRTVLPQAKSKAIELPRNGQMAQLKAIVENNPRVSQLARFAAMANSNPNALIQREMADTIHNSPAMIAQRKIAESINGGSRMVSRAIFNRSAVAQAKTDVKEDRKDATNTETSNKKINTPTQGEKWFRFSKDDKKINSFANNITTESPKGSNPVSATIDLANSDEVKDKSEIPDMSRPVHFRLGDKLIGKNADDRAGKWTWHHKIDPYKMELVDMHAHGGFYHYGGFSQWGDMDIDDSKTI